MLSTYVSTIVRSSGSRWSHILGTSWQYPFVVCLTPSGPICSSHARVWLSSPLPSSLSLDLSHVTSQPASRQGRGDNYAGGGWSTDRMDGLEGLLIVNFETDHFLKSLLCYLAGGLPSSIYCPSPSLTSQQMLFICSHFLPSLFSLFLLLRIYYSTVESPNAAR